MIFDIECDSKKGQKPKKYTTENQDAFYARENGKWCCLCIADGAGSKKHSTLGAKWLTRDVSEYLLEHADGLIESNELQVRSEVMNCIRQSLSRTVKFQIVDYFDLSSTMLCVLTDGNRCMVLHMGDGVVLAVRDGYLNVLSFPMNGKSKRSTALTTMITAEQHLRIQKMSCESISVIWLMTDGAMYKVFQENYGLNGEELSMSLIRQKLLDGNDDDATYGFIKWRIS